MDLTPLTHSILAVQLHAGAALLATLLGTVVMLMKKGTRIHKAMGRVWLGLMAAVALSSFGITEVRMFGPYSLLHALSVFTLFSLVGGFWAARTGNLLAHRSTMISLYVFALLLTGGFTLLPGRRMHAVIFADGGTTAGLVVLAILVAVGTMIVIQRRRGVRLI
ncbi:DUF2306 domain-containing protein [Pelagibacterium xiamenense]|uniref:DUF2306 domain-containing protein n=1 Tax=Pelagibacterium xiamenense TaxID=2901140 RepID=UPI001E6248BF|nr:DUF2306 domain-containing protein [Pelagibacterium xiamenense]MCD7058751.1 DUF2306 domain-containing protein [Pelagibacterium xiamenense]